MIKHFCDYCEVQVDDVEFPSWNGESYSLNIGGGVEIYDFQGQSGKNNTNTFRVAFPEHDIKMRLGIEKISTGGRSLVVCKKCRIKLVKQFLEHICESETDET